MLPHLAGPAAQPAALPERRRRAGLLAEGHPRDRARLAAPLARDRGRRRDDRDANDHLIADRVAALCWLGNQASFEIHAWTGQAARPVAADLRLHRHRPGREDDLGGDAHPRPAVPDGARAPRRARLPEDDRQARDPGLDPDRAEVHLRATPATGSSRCRGPSGRPSRTSSRGSGRRARARARPASTTPRTRRSRRSSRRMRCGPRPAPRSRRRSPGTSSTTRTCGPTAGRSGRSSSGSRSVGDLFARGPDRRPGAPRGLTPERAAHGTIRR